MSEIDFSREQKTEFAEQLQTYLADELSVEIGQFDAEFLFDFIAKEMGGHFYNKGLQDAQQVVEGKLSEVTDSLIELSV